MNLSYAVWLAVSSGAALWVAWMGWKRRGSPGGPVLAWLMLALSVWSLTYAAYWISNSTEARFFWLRMTYFGAVAAPVGFFILVLHFIGHGDRMRRGAYFLLAVIPVLTLIFLWTDSWHGLFFGKSPDHDASMIFHGGPWFYVSVVYLYGLMLIGVVLLSREYLHSHAFFRRQARVMLAGGLIPWMINVFLLLGWNPLPGLDLTPLAFTGTGLLFAYGFFGYRLMDLTPVARDVLVENLKDGIVVLDLAGRVVDINPKAMELADPGIDLPYGKPVDVVFGRWSELARQYDMFEGNFEIRLPKSPYSILDLRIIPLKDRQGKILGRLVTWRDITAQHQAEEEMRLFRYAVEQNPSAIVITDPEGRIEYVNAQFTELTGYTLQDARGKTPRMLKSGETSAETYSELWNTIKAGQVWNAEIINRKKNGELYWADQVIAPVLDAQGRVTHFIAMQQDITLRKHNESELRAANTRLEVHLAEIEQLHEQLREESVRDGLTRLFNRRYMEETLEREFSRAERGAMSISAVMMDVDQFKSINDTFGHPSGDNVLQTLGALLLENTRLGDIACRYGGDEVVVLMPDASLDVALRRAEEWRAAFSLMEFTFGDERLRTSLSVGVASFPDHAQNPSDLLLAADKALYRAKTKRNAVVSYDPVSMARSLHRSDDIR